MAFGLNRRLLNFLMSGWFFDDKKNKARNNPITWNNNSKQNNNKEWNVYDTKMDYVSKVTWFLEEWVKQMRKDIKKL